MVAVTIITSVIANTAVVADITVRANAATTATIAYYYCDNCYYYYYYYSYYNYINYTYNHCYFSLPLPLHSFASHLHFPLGRWRSGELNRVIKARIACIMNNETGNRNISG